MDSPLNTYPEISSSSECFISTPQERLDELNVFPPLAPTHLMVDVPMDGTATITWTPPFVPPGGSAQSLDYSWMLVGGPGTVGPIPYDAISVDLTGLDTNIPYYFVLRANNEHGASYPARIDFEANAVGPHYITSFTPTSGMAGDSVTISGAGFLGATSVTIGGQACAFTVTSDGEIAAVVGTTTGIIEVVSPVGASHSHDTFTVVPTPPPIVVTSFAPTSGYAGDTIVITGSGFTGATAVKINGAAVDSSVVNSDTEIEAVVSDSNTTGKISVKGPGGMDTSSGIFTVMHSGGPTITSFDPISGEPGTVIRITGSQFTFVTNVALNGSDVDSYDIITDNLITAVVSDTNTTGKILITAPSGATLSADNFTVAPRTSLPPTITSITPLTGASGTRVVVIGSGFYSIIVPAYSYVKLNGLEMDFYNVFSIDSDSQLSFTISHLNTSGTLEITNPYGTVTSEDSFTVIPSPPVITSFSPTSGPSGTEVRIQGTGFYGATSVLLNGGAIDNLVINGDTEIVLNTKSTNTSGNFTVTTPNGTATSSTFTVTAPVSVPTITSFTPTSGRSATKIVITGTGFTGVTSVFLQGGTYTNRFTINSGTQITLTTDVADTTSHITVTKPTGSVTSAGTFTALPSVPIITSFTPVQGTHLSEVTLTGQGFEEATVVQLNGVNVAAFHPIAGQPVDTKMLVTPSSYNTSGKFSVTNADGTGTSSGIFTFLPTKPDITSFSPTSGPPGTTIVILGVRFTGVTTVGLEREFYRVEASSFVINSDTKITATMPSSSIYGGAVFVNSPSEGDEFSDGVFTTTGASAAPLFNSFSPTSGKSGTSVIITGSGFTGTTSVKLNGADRGGWTVNSDAKITKIIQSNDTTGRFTVTKSAGSYTDLDSFTVVPSAPTITSFSPTSGMSGTTVTINGSNFTGATNVKLGGTAVASFSVLSAIQIRAVTSSSNATGKFVVTTPNGSDTSAGTFTVAAPVPKITSFTPSGGSSGTVITITGTHFTGATGVRIAGGNVASFAVNSDTTIHATVGGSNITGLVSVVTPAGTATSSTNFTVTGGGGGGGGL